MNLFDVVIVGAGAAGLHCAGIAGQRGLKVLLLDHAPKLGEKIRISGGGRCNFTNRQVGPENFLSADPAFSRTALASYTPQDFIGLVRRHRIAFHEKHKGQLFCDTSSEQIVQMLLRETEAGGVQRWQPCKVAAVRQGSHGFELDTDRGMVASVQLVVATGGLPVPQIGASDFGLRLAKQFGHKLVDTRPALVPLTFSADSWQPLAGLAGLSLPVRLRNQPADGSGAPQGEFLEDLLFTHRGLSGPGILQVSSYWQPGTALQIDLAPGQNLATLLRQAKQGSRRKLSNALGEWLPRRLADAWLTSQAADIPDRFIAECRDKDLLRLAAGLQAWMPQPDGTAGYRKAEVMAGGVDTRELQPHSLASRRVPGLFFIGEVVDVTGWLGGYNFQWAWASAWACAHALVGRPAAARAGG